MRVSEISLERTGLAKKRNRARYPGSSGRIRRKWRQRTVLLWDEFVRIISSLPSPRVSSRGLEPVLLPLSSQGQERVSPQASLPPSSQEQERVSPQASLPPSSREPERVSQQASIPPSSGKPERGSRRFSIPPSSRKPERGSRRFSLPPFSQAPESVSQQASLPPSSQEPGQVSSPEQTSFRLSSQRRERHFAWRIRPVSEKAFRF